MKNEILTLIASPAGSFRVNSISVLVRATADYFGNKTDRLFLDFDTINGIQYCARTEITARDYAGIIAEIDEATATFMAEVTRRIRSDLKAGLVRKGRR